jgi:hypothetical protein
MLRTAVWLVAVLALAGCAAGDAGYVYLRADGQDFNSNPTLYQQFEKDNMVCWDGPSASDSGPAGWQGGGTDVAAGKSAAQQCMKDKGYLVVPADVADLKQQELAAKAAEEAQRAAAAAAPPPPPPPPPPVAPKKVAAKPKPKLKPVQLQPTAPPAPAWPAPTPQPK